MWRWYGICNYIILMNSFSETVILNAMINPFSTIRVESAHLAGDDAKNVIRLTAPQDGLGRLLDKNMECRVEFPNRPGKNAVIQDITQKENKILLTCKLK